MLLYGHPPLAPGQRLSSLERTYMFAGRATRKLRVVKAAHVKAFIGVFSGSWHLVLQLRFSKGDYICLVLFDHSFVRFRGQSEGEAQIEGSCWTGIASGSQHVQEEGIAS
eukprot:670629-Amphidinium_carterae.1